MEDQRCSVSPGNRRNLSNDDPVVATALDNPHAAIQSAERASDVRWPRFATPMKINVELLQSTAREMSSQIALFVAEYVHSERRTGLECCQTRALIAQTPQNERRLQ
jgi:hypothetical protein